MKDYDLYCFDFLKAKQKNTYAKDANNVSFIFILCNTNNRKLSHLERFQLFSE